jgi:sugar/nucleoside kinase (ribokinase family)
VEAINMIKKLKMRSINELLDLGINAAVVINKEDRSSSIYTRGKLEEIPSALRTVRDPTGASDAYIGAFLAGLTKGYSLRSAGMIGSIEASFAVEGFGAQTNLPDWDSLCQRHREIFEAELS